MGDSLDKEKQSENNEVEESESIKINEFIQLIDLHLATY